MDINNAFKTLSIHYSIPIETVKSIILNYNTDTNININRINDTIDSNKSIILPFCGVINEFCCKAVVYNHGLYTQCKTISSSNICRRCNKLKYGIIEDRHKFEKNKFITSLGKREIPYKKFMEKMKYNIDDVKEALKEQGLVYEFDCEKNIKTQTRGRPKKVLDYSSASDVEEDDEIEVEIITITGIKYFKTKENVLLNPETSQIIGYYKGGVIIEM